MEQNIERILISQEELQSRIKAMAEEVSKDYEGKDPVLWAC